MKIRYKAQTLVALGFSASILLILIIISLWTYGENENRKQADKIIEEQIESRRISILLNGARQRTIALYKMSFLDDPFTRDDVYKTFLDNSKLMIKSREAISSFDFTPNEEKTWERVRNLLNSSAAVQGEILELISLGRRDEAYKLLVTTIAPIQEEMTEKLTKILDIEEGSLTQELKKTAENNKNIYVLIVLLGVLAAIIGLLTYAVTKRTAQTELALTTQADRIRSLYEVASGTGLSFSNQIHETLKVGCRLFNLDIGKLCKIDLDENTNTFVDIVVPTKTNININKGMVVPLEKTFCSIPYSENSIVMIDNIVTSKYRSYPCNEFANLGSYIATPITVNGIKYGTINFSSFKAKLMPYSQTDEDLLYLIGRWVGVALERQMSEQYQIEKKVAEDADSAKSAFLANMSHEFRTPLNAIIGYSELLIEDGEETSKSEISADLLKIVGAGKHLLSLVTNVLDLSKIESGKMELFIEEFSVEEVVNSVIDTIRPLVEKNSNVFEIPKLDCSVNMCSDKTKLQQMLLNLFSNSAKFTENGKISFQVAKKVIDGVSFIEFFIRDTGIGMTREQTTKVFDEFTQADNTITSKYGGTGLGLSICKKFSHILGGDIKVISDMGKGSEFSLILPMNVNSAEIGIKSTNIAT